MLPKLWDTLRKRFQRAYKGEWDYLAFVEGQQQTRGGMPHFHIISTRPLPIETSKTGYTSKHKVHNFARLFGFGYECDQKAVSDKGAAYYVSKYASKQDASVPRGTRRVRATQSWYKDPKAERKPLLVPARNEDLAHFIDRVSSETGISHETLANAYIDAKAELRREQERARGNLGE